MTSSVGWTEKKLQSTSQSQTCIRKGHGHCLVVCSPFDHSGFLSPSETITSEKYAQQSVSWTKKLQWLQLTLVNRMGPVLLHENSWLQRIIDTSKVEQIGLQNFASSAILIWPLTNWLPLLQASQQLFAGKMLPHPAGGRKCFPRAYWIPKHGFLYYRNK